MHSYLPLQILSVILFSYQRPAFQEQQTLRLMRLDEKIIYGGRIRTDTLVGEPDLLVCKGNGYVAGDTKSKEHRLAGC
jgi:hypothetical protein